MDGFSLASSAAAYSTVCLVVLLLFGVLRKASGLHKFFAPNR